MNDIDDDFDEELEEEIRLYHREQAAEAANRVPVTAKWLFEEGTDVTAYILNDSNMVTGLDEWVEITGVDATPDGSEIILEHGRTSEMRVAPDYQVYISKT